LYLPDDDAETSARVAGLLEDGLTVDEAVEVALLNNRTLQAAFMDVGIARADVVQAGLLSNPSLFLSSRLPDGGGLSNLEATLAQNIAELWQIPVRTRAAGNELDQAILRLARLASVLAVECKAAYYEAVGQSERLVITRENLNVVESLLDIAVQRQQAGAATQLDVNLSQSLAVDAELAVESARLVAADARRRLATLLGLESDAEQLHLANSLPDPPTDVFDAEALVTAAQASRLDVRAAREAVNAAEWRVKVQYRRIFPVVELGLALERANRGPASGRDILADTARASIANGALTAPEIEPRSTRQKEKGQDVIIGPSLGLELPIFDQNQAQIAKARYAHQQAAKTLEAVERAVAQEVRGAVDRAATARRVAGMYRDRSVPLAQSNLELSRQAYQAGQASFLAVLEAQRFFLDSRRGYIEAARAAAVAIPELERAVGLPFGRFIATNQEQPSVDVQNKPEVGEMP